ncbi:MAG TPA: HD domain-containing protein, partial [Roseiflexaceae bacterium]|nr:HD domain-containing protein [Roseiflexaceae bacterium]
MSDILEQLRPILTAIQAAGGQPLIVGGAVRDMLLGHAPKDLDVEVYRLDVEQLAAALAPFGRLDAVGRSFGVLKLRTPAGQEFDFALPRRESKIGAGHRGFLAAPDPTMTPQEAAARRDFTINAMALTPDGQVLDFFGGQADLRDRVLRHTTNAFAEDPLRVLRGMQFAARFDMLLAPETAALGRALLPEAPTLPIERVWAEWWKWASKSVRPSAGLRALEETGWISLYPELVALIDCPQDPVWHPEGQVGIHNHYVVDAASTIAVRDGLEGEERAVLLFAALCHDLGKPATTSHESDGRIRSPGHDQAGIAPTQSLLRRIGCPHDIAAQVVPLVREHMNHIGMAVTDRAVRRLALRLAPATIEQWGRLVEADHNGRPPLPPGNPAYEIVALAQRLGAAEGRPEPILLGRHVIEAGMLRPGPQLGALLRRAYQAQIDGAFATAEEGLEWAAQNINHEEH